MPRRAQASDDVLVMTASDFGFSAIGLDARAETVSRIQSLGFKAQMEVYAVLSLRAA